MELDDFDINLKGLINRKIEAFTRLERSFYFTISSNAIDHDCFKVFYKMELKINNQKYKWDYLEENLNYLPIEQLFFEEITDVLVDADDNITIFIGKAGNFIKAFTDGVDRLDDYYFTNYKGEIW